MSFFFVDVIKSVDTTRITGQKFFGHDEPMQYLTDSGERQIISGVISEAIGQLASWFCLKQNRFSARPVFLFADKILIQKSLKPGSLVDLSAEIHRIDEETVTFSGRAQVNGETIQDVRDCSGYFMPLAQLEDPAVTRRRFAELVDGGLPLDPSIGTRHSGVNLSCDPMSDKAENTLSMSRTFLPDESYYTDHFSRYPVTPIVLLNEMIGVAATKLAQRKFGAAFQGVIPRSVHGVKIRSFVRPGDTCIINVREKETTSTRSSMIEIVADLQRDDKKILRGTYSYEVKSGDVQTAANS